MFDLGTSDLYRRVGCKPFKLDEDANEKTNDKFYEITERNRRRYPRPGMIIHYFVHS